ncbi:hypothetical protein [Nitrosopumilus sp.]|uniref:hypothetical protein n=1 Tax=Nitrosopumilus sp. TaxID=2024843 RepID=UPI003B5C75EF
MAIIYIIVGALASIGIILLRYYLEQRKRESAEGKICYECNKPVPKSYKLCPRCGLPPGT